ncbi:MAG: hypothetical protein AB7S26_06480 [Sandaracinaceae bacterium]
MSEPPDRSGSLPDPSFDQEIIDCWVAEEPERLRALAARAGGVSAVTARAKALGLTREFIRTCRDLGARATMRECMRCDRGFLSWGPRNRLCKACVSRGA